MLPKKSCFHVLTFCFSVFHVSWPLPDPQQEFFWQEYIDSTFWIVYGLLFNYFVSMADNNIIFQMNNYFDTFSVEELEINEWYREYLILLLFYLGHWFFKVSSMKNWKWIVEYHWHGTKKIKKSMNLFVLLLKQTITKLSGNS